MIYIINLYKYKLNILYIYNIIWVYNLTPHPRHLDADLSAALKSADAAFDWERLPFILEASLLRNAFRENRNMVRLSLLEALVWCSYEIYSSHINLTSSCSHFPNQMIQSDNMWQLSDTFLKHVFLWIAFEDVRPKERPSKTTWRNTRTLPATPCSDLTRRPSWPGRRSFVLTKPSSSVIGFWNMASCNKILLLLGPLVVNSMSKWSMRKCPTRDPLGWVTCVSTIHYWVVLDKDVMNKMNRWQQRHHKYTKHDTIMKIPWRICTTTANKYAWAYSA